MHTDEMIDYDAQQNPAKYGQVLLGLALILIRVELFEWFENFKMSL